MVTHGKIGKDTLTQSFTEPQLTQSAGAGEPVRHSNPWRRRAYSRDHTLSCTAQKVVPPKLQTTLQVSKYNLASFAGRFGPIKFDRSLLSCKITITNDNKRVQSCCSECNSSMNCFRNAVYSARHEFNPRSQRVRAVSLECFSVVRYGGTLVLVSDQGMCLQQQQKTHHSDQWILLSQKHLHC